MTTEIGTIRDAFKMMQALLENKDSLLKLNDTLWRQYHHLIGRSANSHRIDMLLARFLQGDEGVTKAVLQGDDTLGIDTLLADWAGGADRHLTLA